MATNEHHRYWIRLHGLLSFVPLSWVVLFVTSIVIGTAGAGHIPVYGADPSLGELGLEWLNLVSLSLVMIALGALPFIPTLAVIVWPNNPTVWRHTFAYCLGIALFIVAKYLTPHLLSWFFD